MKNILFILSILAVSTVSLSAQSGVENEIYSYQINYSRGDSLYRAGDYEEAIEQLTAAILTKKSDPNVFLLRARAYIKVGEINRAKRDLRSAQRIGNYRADLLMDSLMSRTPEDPKDAQFEKDLENYLQKTD